MAIRALSICSGIGGLDLGWKLASGGRIVCYVERDAYAAATLVARMEGETLDCAPIWSDLLTLDCRRWRGRVDGAIGGIPCQPYSAAGRELGAKDVRDLWPALLRILRECGLEWLFLENVARFASNPDGLARVLVDLAEMGWDAQWGVFSNASLGAPHRRERLFLLAYSERGKLRIQQGRGCWPGGQGPAEPGDYREELGDALRSRREGSPGPESTVFGDHIYPGQELANASFARLERRRRPTEGRVGEPQPGLDSESLADSEILGRDEGLLSLEGEATVPNALGGSAPFWPPGQSPALWRDIPRELWPAAPKHDLRGVADGLPCWMVESNRYRTDRLRCLGNAVSPPVAAVAWRVLTERI